MHGFVSKHARLGEGFSRRERVESFVHPGRRTDPVKGYQSAVAWISDLMDNRKLILLCSFCRIKFDFRKYHYRKFVVPDSTGKRNPELSQGMCDACKGQCANLGGGIAYIEETTFSQLCIDPAEAKRKRRAQMGEVPIWRAVDQLQRR